jgi:protein NrfD
MNAQTSLFRPFTLRNVADTPYLPRELPWRQILWAFWFACLVLGGWGVYQRFAQGHLPAGYGSYVPWGLWVGLYFHGVGMAGGAFAIGALGYVLGWTGFQREKHLRQVIVLAMAAILPAFFAIWLDLGHLDRFHYIFLHPSFTSMMAFNAWMYYAFMLVMGICWVLSYRPSRQEWLKPLLCLAALFSILFPSQSGAFFGVVDAKGHWHSALLPMMFLLSAITAGAALLMLVRILIDASADHELSQAETGEAHGSIGRLRIITMAGIVGYFAFEFAEFSIALWNPYLHAPALHLVLFGPYWWVFWIVHVLIGGLLPLTLLAGRWKLGWTIAALLVSVCFLSARLNVLIPGQAVGEILGLQEAFQDERLRYIYHATPMEYLVGLFVIALGMAAFVVGRRLNFAAHRWLTPRSETQT